MLDQSSSRLYPATSSHSLTFMDDDLYKEGIVCPNEAEFRTYFILTHLLEDVSEYLSQMRDEIIYSEPVQRALKVT